MIIVSFAIVLIGLFRVYFHKVGYSSDLDDNNTIPLLGNPIYCWNVWIKCPIFIDDRAGYLNTLKNDTNRSSIVYMKEIEYASAIYCYLQFAKCFF